MFTLLYLPVCLGLLDRLDLFILFEKKVVWCFILVISFYLWSVVHTFSSSFKGEILVATSREQLRLWSCTQWPQGCIPESTVNSPSAKPWTFSWLTPNLAYSRYVVPKTQPGVSSFNSRVCSWLRLKTFSTEHESLWKRTLRKSVPCCFFLLLLFSGRLHA